MTIFNYIYLIGGLAFFLFGMDEMSKGLEKVAGGKLQKILRKLTSNRFKGLLLGAGVTAIIQSSGAVTVMLVGLVNSGIMQLQEAIPVIMGSNIGTTVTAWILSLTGISSDSIGIQLLQPKNFSPILALIGVIMMMSGGKQKKKDIGSIIMGFAVLMYGMTTMSESMEPLADSDYFTSFITTLSNNPILGVLFGIVFTALLQSSSASVGVIQALSLTGIITYGTVIPIIMGQNIGTCVVAIIAAIGTNKNAKRVAAVHVSFNVIATVVFLSLWLILDAIFNFPIKDQTVMPYNIAILHSIFNLAATALMLPFCKQLAKLAKLIVRDGTKGDTPLNDTLLTIPAFAVDKAFEVTSSMAKVSRDAIQESIGLLKDTSVFDEKAVENIQALEAETDTMEDELSNYLVKISKTNNLSEKDLKTTSTMMHTISDFERLADHATNLVDVAREKHDKELEFYPDTQKELDTLYQAVTDIVCRTTDAFTADDPDIARTIEPLEEVIDNLIMEVKSHMVTRLQSGNSTVETGFIMNDLLTNLERVSDHCSNVAVAVIEGKHGAFDQHEYLEMVKAEPSGNFIHEYENFTNEYSIDSQKKEENDSQKKKEK